MTVLPLSVVERNLFDLISHLLVILSLLLLGRSIFFRFFFKNLLLGPERIKPLIRLNLIRNQVTLHPIKHMVVGALQHLLKIVLLDNPIQVGLRAVNLIRSAVILISQVLFIIIGLLELTPQSFELLFLLESCSVGLIKLVLQFAHSV